MNIHRIPALSALALCIALVACNTTSGSSATGPGAQAQENIQPVTVPQIILPHARQTTPIQSKGKPLQIADAISVSIKPDRNGLWSAWDENNDRWRIDLKSQGARSLNLHFDRFVLPQGAILRLYSPEQPRRGIQLTAAENKPHGAYWSPEIAGDTLRLDLILPRSYGKKIGLSIADVNVAW